MIWRFVSAVLLVYALGFVLFAFTLGKPAAVWHPAIVTRVLAHDDHGGRREGIGGVRRTAVDADE